MDQEGDITMETLGHGSIILPTGFCVSDFEIRFNGVTLYIEMRSDEGQLVTLEAVDALSFRFSAEDSFQGYIEGSLDTLLVLEEPGWCIRYLDEDTFKGNYVRERSFFHINIPDVGIAECWAITLNRRSSMPAKPDNT